MRTLLAFGLLSLAVATLAPAPKAKATADDTAGGHAGTRLVYTLYYSNASIADFASLAGSTTDTGARTEQAPPPDSKSFTTSLKGSLVVTILRVDPAETLLALSWQDLDIAISYNGVEATSDEERIRSALRQEVYAAVTSEGRIIRVEFAPGVDATSQGCVRTILANLQFVTGSTSVLPKSWDTEEEGVNGTYLAHYEASPDDETSSSSRLFTKKKLKYLARAQAPGSKVTAIPVTIVPDGETRLRRDLATGHLVSVHGTEHEVITLSGRTLADSKSELAVTLTTTTAAAASEIDRLQNRRQSLLESLSTTSLSQTKRNRSAENLRREQALRGSTADNLLESLSAVETAAASDQQNGELAEKLEALFLLHPESCPAFEAILSKAPRGNTSFRMLLTVLSRVGHGEAQALLRHALSARRDEKAAVVLLIHALSSVEAPDMETEAVLREKAFGSDLRTAGAAQLALGTLAGHLAQTEPLRAAQIVRALAEHIESSPSIEEKTRLLGALGNARTTEAVAIVQRYLDGSNADLREPALSVMLRMQPDRADEILTTHLLVDTSDSVRVAAARELASRTATVSTFSAQKKVFLSDATTSVRTTVVAGLWRARDLFPEATALVTHAATHDLSEEVRKVAGQLIAASSPST